MPPLAALRDKPAGTIRLNAGDHPVDTILLPKLIPLLATDPDIKVEVVIDQGLTDIVIQRFDAGFRLGKQVAGDMIAVRIGPDVRKGVVGSPAYFAAMPPPVVLQDLTHHRCIKLRM